MERNYLEELKEYVDYDGIIRLINIIARTKGETRTIKWERSHDVNHYGEIEITEDTAIHFEYEDEVYTIERYNGSIVISCSDGRSMEVSFNMLGPCSQVYVEVRVNNDINIKVVEEYFELIERDFEVYQIGVSDIKKSIPVMFLGRTSPTKYSLINDVRIGNIGDDPEEREPIEGKIRIGDMVLTSDCSRIVSWNNGERIYTPEEIEGMREEDSSYENKVKCDNYEADSREAYNDLPLLQSANNLRLYFSKGYMPLLLFTKKEMGKIIGVLYKTFKEQISKSEKAFGEEAKGYDASITRKLDEIVASLIPSEAEYVGKKLSKKLGEINARQEQNKE